MEATVQTAAGEMDPGTGEVSPDREAQPLPPTEEEVVRRQKNVPLETGEQVLEEIRQESLRMDTVARRLTDCQQQLDGKRVWNGESWDFYTGVAFDYASAVEEKERELWRMYQSGNLRSWPRESTMRSIVHEEMDPVLRQQYEILKEEKKRLEIIQKLLSQRMDGLRSLLSYHKTMSQLAGTSADEPPRGILD